MTRLDGLLRMLKCAYVYDDKALVSAVLAAARYLIIKDIDLSECVDQLAKAYTVEGHGEEHTSVVRRMLLTKALCMRPNFGLATDALKKALQESELLREDWERGSYCREWEKVRS
jgi:hypothetical protein